MRLCCRTRPPLPARFARMFGHENRIGACTPPNLAASEATATVNHTQVHGSLRNLTTHLFLFGSSIMKMEALHRTVHLRSETQALCCFIVLARYQCSLTTGILAPTHKALQLLGYYDKYLTRPCNNSCLIPSASIPPLISLDGFTSMYVDSIYYLGP
jgi:hypothetical protein